MEWKTRQKELFQYNGDKPFKLIVSAELETKIRTFCALSPDREWSGVLFYLFEGNFENGVTIFANDMYLMDQGNGVHTEFDLDSPEITRHLVMEGLTNHCMGLIHSHNHMRAFFSGEDSSTLVTHGSHMHNFVSLVVNNDGNYVARLTRQVNFNGVEEKILRGKVESPLFNTDEVETQDYLQKHSTEIKNDMIQYVDLEIIKEEPNISSLHQSIERFGEINSKCSSQKATMSSGKALTVQDWTDGKQGTLFDDYDVKDEFVIPEELMTELNLIPWKSLGYNGWLCQLLYGSPFAIDTPITAQTFTTLSSIYKERFKNEMDFAAWFEVWLDYLVADFDFPLSKQSEFIAADEALLYQTYRYLSDKKIVYKDMMLKCLTNRML